MAPSWKSPRDPNLQEFAWMPSSLWVHEGWDGDIEARVEPNDVPLRARFTVMTAIFFVSLFAVSLPSLSTRKPTLRIPRLVFFAGKHFGTGIILSTAFCHLLQDAFQALHHPSVKAHSRIGDRTGFIVLASVLSIFLVEYLSTAFVNRLQANPSAPQSPNTSPVPSRSPSPHPPHQKPPHVPHHDTCRSSMPSLATLSAKGRSDRSSPSDWATGRSSPSESSPLLSSQHTHPSKGNRPRSKSLSSGTQANVGHDWDAMFFEGHHRHERRETHEAHHSRSQRRHEPDPSNHDHARHVESSLTEVSHAHTEISPTAIKIGKRRQVVGILVLQFGIMIHSFVIGLTLSIVSSEFASLVTAILFHQLFEGLSLGIRISSLPASTAGESPRLRLFEPTLSLLFALTTPVGILIGLWSFSEGTDTGRLKLTQGVMSAISAGMLIYSACVEMLAGDFILDTLLWRSSMWKQVLALVSLFAGVGSMAMVGK